MKGLSSHHQFMEKITDIKRSYLWKWIFITSRLTGLIYTSIKVTVSNSRFQINGMHSWFRSDHILPLYQSASFNSLQILNREKKNAHGCFKREYHSNWLANSTHIQMWYLFTPLNNWPLGIYLFHHKSNIIPQYNSLLNSLQNYWFPELLKITNALHLTERSQKKTLD